MPNKNQKKSSQRNSSRYESMQYAPCGKSGLKLPPVSLGCWQNFGGESPFDNTRKMLCRAFDLGITHFDLANNYGPPPGSAEISVGKVMSKELKAHRDELILSTKAGYLMWPGPYGEWGSKKYMIASLDQSLRRMKVDYVDIFYSHRFDPNTPLEETMGALEQVYRQGKALYVGISNYQVEPTQRAYEILAQSRIPITISQMNYSMLQRKVEGGLLDLLKNLGTGMITFSSLAQGVLTDKYLAGIPKGSRAASGQLEASRTGIMKRITPAFIRKIGLLNELAQSRGQTLARMAIQWVLRHEIVVSAIIGASKVSQIEDMVKILKDPPLTQEELQKIDQYLEMDEGGS